MKYGKFEIDLAGGKLVSKYNIASEEQPQLVEVHVPLAAVAVPVLDGVQAKIESGEIDPIKGTDLDKEAMLKAIAFLKLELAK